MTTSATALRRILAALAVSLPNNVPPCAAVVQLSLPAIPVAHDRTYLHADHARLPWSAFPLCRGKVRTPPRGGSNPYDRIPNDRAALSREFPRNWGPGGLHYPKKTKSPENRVRCGMIATCSRLSGLFFFAFSFSFVQNGTDLSKEYEESKNVFKSSCFRGFETSAFLAYCQRKATTLSSRTLKNEYFMRGQQPERRR